MTPTAVQLLAPIIVALGGTYVATPVLARKLIQKGMVGVDVHKPSKPVCAEMGGIAVLIGLVFGVSAALLVGASFSLSLWGAILTVCLVAGVGALDDLTGMRQRHKVLLVALASIPLILAYEGKNAIWLPAMGQVDIGVIYPF